MKSKFMLDPRWTPSLARSLDLELCRALPSRPLLITLAPDPGLGGWPLLTNRCGEILGEYAGLVSEEQSGALGVLRESERVSLFSTEEYDHPTASKRDKAQALLSHYSSQGFLGGRRVVLVGHVIARAFQHGGEVFQWEEATWGRTRYFRALIPYPVGPDNWWSPADVERASYFLRTLFDPSSPKLHNDPSPDYREFAQGQGWQGAADGPFPVPPYPEDPRSWEGVLACAQVFARIEDCLARAAAPILEAQNLLAGTGPIPPTPTFAGDLREVERMLLRLSLRAANFRSRTLAERDGRVRDPELGGGDAE